MYRLIQLFITAAVVMAVVAACSTPPAAVAANPSVPLLRLAPAALGRTLSLQQLITVQIRTPHGEQTREIQALLEADATHTRLAALAGGQVLARLDWDGTDLRATRSPWAPAEVVPERILSDLQLSLWPVPAIRAALPAGWRLEASAGVRRLVTGDDVAVEVSYPNDMTTEFVQHRDGYRLTIRTLAMHGEQQ